MARKHRHLLPALAAALILGYGPAQAQSVNAGDREASSSQPFAVETLANFNTPWAMAFLPDGRLLITEKPGAIYLVSQSGEKTEVGNVPAVLASGQNGLLDIAIAPDFDASSRVYYSYVEPDEGGRLVLASATLAISDAGTTLADNAIVWRQTPAGGRGQPGGIIAFDPEGKHLFLSVGDRMEPASAQDAAQARGKVIRLNLDGTVPSDNPFAGQGDVQGVTWTTGHRNPYGLAFAEDGRLWLHEMGPQGGDEFNLIEKGSNYGWPVVSNGDEYSGAPIPDHDTHPEFAAPAVYWNPVIAPAGLAFYDGELFPDWKGSALIGGLRAQALVRVAFDAEGRPDEAERWTMGGRIRDVAVAPDGAVWLIEDAGNGRLMRLTPGD